MEKSEEIETTYYKQVEALDKEFLEKFNRSKEIERTRSLEKDYKHRLAKIRKQYESSFNRYLLLQKNLELQQTRVRVNRPVSTEKVEPLKIRPINIRRSSFDKFKDHFTILRFRFQILRNRFLKKITPNFLLIFRLRLWIFFRESTKSVINLLLRTFALVRQFFLSLFSAFTSTFNFLFGSILSISYVLVQLLSFRSKKPNKSHSSDKIQ